MPPILGSSGSRFLSRKPEGSDWFYKELERKMYAVVEAGGRQVELTPGSYVEIDMVAAESDQEYVFDKVLMIVNGAESVTGTPYVDGAKVQGRVIDHTRDKKLVVYKYRPKKGTRKRTGHRQHHTKVFINKIELNGTVLAEAQDTKAKNK